MSYAFDWPIYGHKNQLQFLQTAILNNKLANAYLFYGPMGLGKKMVVDYFVKSIFCQSDKVKPCNLCQHCRQIAKKTFLDIHILGKNEELSAENIRDFLSHLSLSNVSGNRRLAIIYGLERINLFGANALLKTLEEPPRNTTIVLVADNIAGLPATIISRCQLLKFRQLSKKDMDGWLQNFDFDTQTKQTIINLSFGKPGLALTLMSDKLEIFKDNCKFIIKLLSNNLFFSLQAIDKWFTDLKKQNPGSKTVELGFLTRQFLDLYEVFLRDILMRQIDRPVVNILFQDEINKIAGSFDKQKLLNNLLAINQSRRSLKNNVAPQLLWENLFLNIR